MYYSSAMGLEQGGGFTNTLFRDYKDSADAKYYLALHNMLVPRIISGVIPKHKTRHKTRVLFCDPKSQYQQQKCKQEQQENMKHKITLKNSYCYHWFKYQAMPVVPLIPTTNFEFCV